MLVNKIEFFLVLIFFANSAHSNIIYICNEAQTKIVELTPERCNIHSEKNDINNILNNNNVMFVDDDTINEVEEPCNQKQSYGFIFPGTLWCGRGTKAKTYDELGIHKEEDKCCREHDNCPSNIPPGECKANLCNKSQFTRSHCDCDSKFQECLKNTGSSTGNLIGAIFFNIVKVNCFVEGKCDNGSSVLISKLMSGESLHNNINKNNTKECSYIFETSPKYQSRSINSPKSGKFNIFGALYSGIEWALKKIKLL